ncbi:MAG: hypothetical protein WKF76_11420 [Nocardioidaceae bacterium]
MRRTASASIQANINTSRLVASCTTAGTSPPSSYRTLSRVLESRLRDVGSGTASLSRSLASR